MLDDPTLAQLAAEIESGNRLFPVVVGLQDLFSMPNRYVYDDVDLAIRLASTCIIPRGGFDTDRCQAEAQQEWLHLNGFPASGKGIPDRHTLQERCLVWPQKREERRIGYPESEILSHFQAWGLAAIEAYRRYFSHPDERFVLGLDGKADPLFVRHNLSFDSKKSKRVELNRLTNVALAALPAFRGSKDTASGARRAVAYYNGTTVKLEFIVITAMFIESQVTIPLGAVRVKKLNRNLAGLVGQLLEGLHFTNPPAAILADREFAGREVGHTLLAHAKRLGAILMVPLPINGTGAPPRAPRDHFPKPTVRYVVDQLADHGEHAVHGPREWLWSCAPYSLHKYLDAPEGFIACFGRFLEDAVDPTADAALRSVKRDDGTIEILGITPFFLSHEVASENTDLFERLYGLRWGATENVYKREKRHFGLVPSHGVAPRHLRVCVNGWLQAAYGLWRRQREIAGHGHHGRSTSLVYWQEQVRLDIMAERTGLLSL